MTHTATMDPLNGRHALTLEAHLQNARLPGRLTRLPVNSDFEDGSGEGPDDVGASRP